MFWTIVVAQLVERLLTNPEIRGSDPVIGTFLSIIYCQLYWNLKRRKEKKKEAENGPFQKTVFKGSPVRVHRLHSWSRVRKSALLARCRNVLGQRLGATATYNA